MNGGKDFCEWSKHDREIALSAGKIVCAFLGQYGKGLVNAALAESFFEKGGDPYEVISLVSKAKLEAAAMRNVNIQMLYRKILEESLIQSQIHADLVRFESAPNRYKRLCDLSPQVVLRAPLTYIANYLQMTPETLSRIRSGVLL